MTTPENDLRRWLRSLPVFADVTTPFDTAWLPEIPEQLFLEWLKSAVDALYALNPSRVEFWQASADREHTRVLYEKRDAGWETSLLWP